MSALVGYARVSTSQQGDRLQLDALREAGCDVVFAEQASTRAHRPELGRVLAELEAGDVLVVWRLDRLTRSLRELLDIVETLEERDMGLRSLREAIDTATAGADLSSTSSEPSQGSTATSSANERSPASLPLERAVNVGGRRPVLTGQRRERALISSPTPTPTARGGTQSAPSRKQSE